MTKTYEATVIQTREVVFTFTEDDLEDGDTLQEAAEELSLAQPDNAWDEVDFDVTVREVPAEEATDD